jgi:hypothetical protein
LGSFAFWLSHGFIIFFIIEISIAPSVGCDPSRDFFMKKKLFRLKKRIARDVLISKRERNNKDGLSSFQAQAAMINKL